MNVRGRKTFVYRLVLSSLDDEMVDAVVSHRKQGKKICFWFQVMSDFWNRFPATWWLNKNREEIKDREVYWKSNDRKYRHRKIRTRRNVNDREKSKKSMMIQKVINYDWDEKWEFRNYDNNWWKLKENKRNQ